MEKHFRQTKLSEFFDLMFKCPTCGRLFKTAKGFNIHLSVAHDGSQAPLIYAGEGIEIETRGAHVILKIRMKETLWRDIKTRIKESQIPLEEFIFKTLVNLASFGGEFKTQIDALMRKPNYIK